MSCVADLGLAIFVCLFFFSGRFKNERPTRLTS